MPDLLLRLARRYARKAFRALVVALCVLVVVFWVRSYRGGDLLVWWSHPKFAQVGANDGLISFRAGVFESAPPQEGWRGSFWPFGGVDGYTLNLWPGSIAGFDYDHDLIYTAAGKVEIYGIVAPYWALMLVAGAMPVLWIRRWRRRTRFVGEYACMGCGYDLRESNERCPECGRPALKEIPQEELYVGALQVRSPVGCFVWSVCFFQLLVIYGQYNRGWYRTGGDPIVLMAIWGAVWLYLSLGLLLGWKKQLRMTASGLHFGRQFWKWAQIAKLSGWRIFGHLMLIAWIRGGRGMAWPVPLPATPWLTAGALNRLRSRLAEHVNVSLAGTTVPAEGNSAIDENATGTPAGDEGTVYYSGVVSLRAVLSGALGVLVPFVGLMVFRQWKLERYSGVDAQLAAELAIGIAVFIVLILGFFMALHIESKVAITSGGVMRGECFWPWSQVQSVVGKKGGMFRGARFEVVAAAEGKVQIIHLRGDRLVAGDINTVLMRLRERITPLHSHVKIGSPIAAADGGS